MRGVGAPLALTIVIASLPLAPAAAAAAPALEPAAGEGAAARPPLDLSPAALDSLFAGADALLRSGAPDSVLAVVRPVLLAALASGDERLELRARLHEAGAEALCGRQRDAERSARRAVALAAAQGAAGPGRMARRWLGFSLLGQGRAAEAISVYSELRDDARAAGDRREEAYALMGLAYQALGRGEAASARADYERSVELFTAVGESAIALDAKVGLARALGAEGRYREMRRLYERLLRDAEQAGNSRVVGYALNNLGSYEYQAGDPGLAVQYWERALDRKRAGADHQSLITPTVNLALARMSLGAFDEARSELQAMLARCREGGYREQEALVLGQLAALEQAHGRAAAARALWRQSMALSAAAGREGLEAASEVVSSLAAEGEAARACALADSLVAAQPAGADDFVAARLLSAQARALLAAARPREALAAAARARELFRDGGFRPDELALLVLMAACERDLAAAEGRDPGRSLALLHEARRLWEEVRAVPRDPRWRERRGTLATSIHMDLARNLLASGGEARAAAAFDLLQGYKARTLLERRLGPDAYTPEAAGGAPATLAQLQGGVLRPGELLLDYYLGEDESLVFAVTAGSCRAYSLPPSRELRSRLALFLDLVAGPRGGTAGAPDHGPAARRLAADLLGPCGADVAAAGSVLVAADGVLNRVPFELLPLPGAAGGEMLVDRALARVPSAGVLASLRAADAAAAPGAPARRGLVLLGVAGQAGDAALPGAAGEARRLEQRYRDVRSLAMAGPVADAGWSSAVAGAAVLHIPAHSEADDQRPWNSRIRVGTGPDGEERWLASAEIAAAAVDVPLAVLSGCSSAGGQALSGEGMLGLSGAFLAAGSRAVVASLWDVDDQAAAQLMDAFYRRLAEGMTVAAALAGARRELADDPATAAPRHWAAFVVVGDGALVVPVERRPVTRAGLAAGALLALAAGAAILSVTARRRDRPVIPGGGRALP